jgi:hypothetical protein
MSEEIARPDGRVQKELPLRADKGRGVKLDVSGVENWLWEAACVIRGPVDIAD